MSVTKQFARYVTQNIFGMLGISCYIIADTFFIAKAAGTDGITVLNLVLPIYNLIFAIGSMIGVGSATRFTILRAQGEERAHGYFSNAICFVWMIGILFTLAGVFIPDKIIGADGRRCGNCGAWNRVYEDLSVVYAVFHDELRHHGICAQR